MTDNEESWARHLPKMPKGTPPTWVSGDGIHVRISQSMVNTVNASKSSCIRMWAVCNKGGRLGLCGPWHPLTSGSSGWSRWSSPCAQDGSRADELRHVPRCCSRSVCKVKRLGDLRFKRGSARLNAEWTLSSSTTTGVISTSRQRQRRVLGDAVNFPTAWAWSTPVLMRVHQVPPPPNICEENYRVGVAAQRSRRSGGLEDPYQRHAGGSPPAGRRGGRG